MKDQARMPVQDRYNDFCTAAEELLKEAALDGPDDSCRITGPSFYEACRALAELYFPDDNPSGTGPRGLLSGMRWAVRSQKDSSLYKDPLSGSRSIAVILRQIIKSRPALDLIREDSGSRWNAASVRQCPFHEQARDYRARESSVFVLMPFSKPWSERLWVDHVRPYLSVTPAGEKVAVKRADDLYGQGVMEDIYEGIVTARVVVAECTGQNPNVLYELGLAHALGKRTALLSQNADDIPFDLRRFRFCIYEDNSGGYPKMRSFLQETLRDAFGA